MRTIDFINSEGVKIYVDIYEAEQEKASLLLVHGSVEHIGRYKDYATWLASKGITVYAPDYLGHGRSLNNNKLGFFTGKKNGFLVIEDDFDHIYNYILEHKKSEKIFILGHSMGSFLVRDYIYKRSKNFTGAIVCGTADTSKFLANASLALIKVVKLFKPWDARVKFVHKIIYDRLSTKEEVNHYLSHDKEIIKKYNEDEACGYVVTLDYANEMAKCLKRLKKEFSLENKKLHLLLISGEKDPVGGKDAKEVLSCYSNYQKHNPSIDVEINIYDNMYHEILNEVGKKDVWHDTLDFFLREND